MEKNDFWNRVAPEYQATWQAEDGEPYRRALQAFLQKKGMLRPGGRVADVGCGVGKYAKLFVQAGCRVTLLDQAEEMLRYARQNMAQLGGQWETICCDITQIRGTEPEWYKQFDTVFASMCPAIDGPDAVATLCRMGRHYGMITRFARMENRMEQMVNHQLGLPCRQPDKEYDSVLQAIRQEGFLPNVTFHDHSWENRLTPEHAAEKIIRGQTGPITPALQEAVQSLTREIAGKDGWVAETVQAKAVWIDWHMA